MLDGITVYNPMHLGGVFSTFNTDAIKEAEFHAGGFPAQYGGRLGSILNIVNREGNTEEITGSANISLISSKLLVEGPLPTGDSDLVKGSWMVAGRRTYFDAIVNTGWKYLVKPGMSEEDRKNAPEKIMPYYFYDFQGKINLDIGSDHRLTWSSFYGDDVLDIGYSSNSSSDDWYEDRDNPNDYYYESTDSGIFDWRWGNFTNSLTWRWILTPQLIAKTFIANSRFRFEVNIDSEFDNYYRSSEDTSRTLSSFNFDLFDRINDNSFESSLTWLPSESHKVLGGFQFKQVHFNLGMIINFSEAYNNQAPEYFRDTIMWMDTQPNESAVYIQDQWQLSPLLSLQTGLRAVDFSLHDTTYFEPRLGLKYFLSDKLSLKGSFGRYHQFLTTANPPEENLRFLDIWFGIPEDRMAPRSDHYIVGLEYLTDSDILMRIETYHKSFDNLLTLKPTELFAIDDDGNLRIDPFNEFWDTDAYADGLEILVKKLSGKVRGWAGYTYAITKRKYEQQDWYFPKYDRTHTLNVVADWALTNGLHFSTAVTYSSGNPYTAVQGRAEDYQEYGQSLNYSEWGLFQSFLYGERYPDYFRLDVSLKKRKPWRYGTKEWYFQILNVTNHLNIFSYIYQNRSDYDYETGQSVNKGVQRLGFPMFPFFPTFGVKYEF